MIKYLFVFLIGSLTFGMADANESVHALSVTRDTAPMSQKLGTISISQYTGSCQLSVGADTTVQSGKILISVKPVVTSCTSLRILLYQTASADLDTLVSEALSQLPADQRNLPVNLVLPQIYVK